jgi:hypothetical protein
MSFAFRKAEGCRLIWSVLRNIPNWQLWYKQDFADLRRAIAPDFRDEWKVDDEKRLDRLEFEGKHVVN